MNTGRRRRTSRVADPGWVIAVASYAVACGQSSAFTPSAAWPMTAYRTPALDANLLIVAPLRKRSPCKRQQGRCGAGVRRGKVARTHEASPDGSLGKFSSNRGLIFPTEKEDGWFDSATVGSPRVHRYLHDEGSRWVMWYHGQDTDWHKEGGGVMDIGTGRIGRAESSDGLTWRRTPGQMSLMSVLDKNTEQWWGFDTAHVGLGDVNLGASSRVASDSSVYFMYYFGGDYEETDVQAEYGLRNPITSGESNAPPKGVRLRIGVALSQDGLNWCRVEGEHPTGACVDVGGEGEWDRLFVGWPIVINHKQEEFRMYYHTLDPDKKKFMVGMATSQDGLQWEKKGPIFDGGPDGAFDEAGAGRRRVVMLDGRYHMIYEGINKQGVHALGLATSTDGVSWERHGDEPVFERSAAGSGAWDAGGVSNPELVETENGAWYLYYTGQPERGAEEGRGATRSAIGVAVATGNDLTSWTRIEA